MTQEEKYLQHIYELQKERERKELEFHLYPLMKLLEGVTIILKFNSQTH